MTDKVWTVEDHLAGATQEHVALYRSIVAIIEACGPTRVSVSKTTITFKGDRRGFAGARPTGRGVEGYLDLTRSLAGDLRIRSAAPYTKRLFVNHYRITSADELDDTFASWIREAYRVGQGDHLLSFPPPLSP